MGEAGGGEVGGTGETGERATEGEGEGESGM